MKKFSAISFTATIFIIWRTLLFIISYYSPQFFPFKASFPYTNTLLVPSHLPNWLWAWANFDGVHYLTLAKKGYDGFGTQAFFPLYPLLISLLTKLTHNEIISGLLISNAAIFFSAVLLYKFATKNFSDPVAKWSVVFLFAFPTSFFFGSVYPEGLLLLLILLSFTTKGVWAGVFAGLASGTKLIGAFIGPILVAFKPRNFWGLLGASGVIFYMLFLWKMFNKPLMFLSAQSAFGNHRATEITSLILPPQVIFRYLKIFATVNVHNFNFWVAALEFAAFMIGLFILAMISKRKLLPKNILIFSWLILILPTFSGTLSSMPRYLLPIFPIYIFLATIQNKWTKVIILVLSISILIFLSVLFTRGYFVS